MTAPEPVILALDTATEQCSIALQAHGAVYARTVATARGHADLILPMIDALMAEAGLTLSAVVAIAFGRGPGGFTGVRLAVSVAQGLAFALDKPVVPISTLATVAQQAAPLLAAGESVLVCMDARMAEVYTAEFVLDKSGHLVPSRPEQVCAPQQVPRTSARLALGTGFSAYAALRERFADLPHASALPNARDLLTLASAEFTAGRAVPAAEALPVYVRDQVTHVKAVTAT